MASFFPLQPLPPNTSKFSSQGMMAGDFSNTSYTNRPLILVVRRRICKNRYMICESSNNNTLPILSSGQTSYILIISFPNRMSPQTSSLDNLLPDSCPANIFLLLSAPSDLIFFIFNANVVIKFSQKKNP